MTARLFLTETERQVVVMLCRKLSKPEIGHILHVPAATISDHVRRINLRLGTHSIPTLIEAVKDNDLLNASEEHACTCGQCVPRRRRLPALPIPRKPPSASVLKTRAAGHAEEQDVRHWMAHPWALAEFQSVINGTGHRKHRKARRLDKQERDG